MPTLVRIRLLSWCAAASLATVVACMGTASQSSLAGDETENNAALTSGTVAYVLSPNIDTTRCLMPQNDVIDNGTPIVLGDCVANANKLLVRTGDVGSLRMTTADGNFCLDVVNGMQDNGTQLQLWQCFTVNDNQKWSMSANQLVWGNNNKCLDVTDGNTSIATNVMQIWDCISDNDNQQWAFHAITLPNTAVAASAGNNPNVAANSTAVAPTSVGTPAVVNQPAASVPAAIVYAAVDVSRASFFSHTGTFTLVNQGNSKLCASLNPTTPFGTPLEVTACQANMQAQQFIFDGNSRIRWPIQDQKIGTTSYAQGSYCLGIGVAGRVNFGTPQFTPCNTGDSNQVWAQAGNVFVSMPSSKCLGYDATSQSATPNIALQACTTNPQDYWTMN